MWMILVHLIKPAFIYDDKGQFRNFGLGYRNYTVFPIWLVSVVLAVMAYLTVTWFISTGV